MSYTVKSIKICRLVKINHWITFFSPPDDMSSTVPTAGIVPSKLSITLFVVTRVELAGLTDTSIAIKQISYTILALFS